MNKSKNKKNNTSKKVLSTENVLDLKDKDTILKEMVRVYENGQVNDTTNFECQATESRLKQLKIIYETLENKELFDAKHGKELPIQKVDIEFVDANDKNTIDEIALLEKQLAEEINVEKA